MNGWKIVLASASPRRKDLLKQIGIDPVVTASHVKEQITSDIPAEVVMELASQKAADIARTEGDKTIVIGSDTVVSIHGKILGKPESHEEAAGMIREISGHSHQVYTGVAILETGENPECECLERDAHVERTDVTVWSMTEEEIREYVATGEPMDKAGGYGIQGAFAVYVKGIRGDYYNVVGFPIAYVAHKVKELVR